MTDEDDVIDETESTLPTLDDHVEPSVAEQPTAELPLLPTNDLHVPPGKAGQTIAPVLPSLPKAGTLPKLEQR